MPTIFKREPVLWQTAVMAIINLLVVFKILNLSGAEIGAINTALAAVLGVIVRQVVTPLADPRTADGTPATLVAKS